MTTPHEIVDSISGITYGGIFLVSLFANLVIPIPEEITLLAIGYVSSLGPVNIWISLPLTIVGLFISDSTLHILAKRGNKHLNKLYGRFQHSRFARYEARLRTHIKLTIFAARFVTTLRFVGPLLSGMMKIPFRVFALMDLLAITLYSSLFIFVGYIFHTKILLIIAGVQVIGHYIFVIIISILVTGVLWYLNKKLLEPDESPIETNSSSVSSNSEEVSSQ